MPEYLYLCENGHEKYIRHRMADDPEIACDECGSIMHRKPLPFLITWGGLKPSDAEGRSPVIKHWLDRDQGKAREDYHKYKEHHTK